MRGGISIRLLAVAFAGLAACSTGGSTPVASRVQSSPKAAKSASVRLETPAATRAVTEVAAAAPRRATVRPAVRRSGDLSAFRGLGAWIDVYDFNNDPSSIVPMVRELASHGVKTLYLETARWKSKTDIQYPVSTGAALDEAKAQGMKVVAWYPPYFTDLAKDLRRSMAAVNFRSPEGNRFDAFGPDIEQLGVKNHAERNRRTIEYSRRLRAMTDMPLAAIVYPPSQLERSPRLWPNYPWKAFGEYYDIVMPMAYWTFRMSDPKAVATYTERNTALSRAWTGKPVHIIGGLAEAANPAEIGAYVGATIESGSVGGSIYDVRTTTAAQWLELAALNR